jgi:tRNA dimethylallyltransferase
MDQINTIIIAGPTASGKSRFAMQIASLTNGVIINGDSMQVYRELPILSAQPTMEDLSVAEHHLYGVFRADQPCSVAKWQALALDEISQAHTAGRMPLIVGGTGLYLQSLIKGLSIIPDIDTDVRDETRKLFDRIGANDFYDALKKLDPKAAKTIRPSDKQRMIRAFEVKESTGISIIDWRKNVDKDAIAHLHCHLFIMDWPGEVLEELLAQRIDLMFQRGVTEEVKAFLAENYPNDLPIMKTIGLNEIAQLLEGELDIEEVREKMIIATRQYAKRQRTWFRNQCPEAIYISGQDAASVIKIT